MVSFIRKAGLLFFYCSSTRKKRKKQLLLVDGAVLTCVWCLLFFFFFSIFQSPHYSFFVVVKLFSHLCLLRWPEEENSRHCLLLIAFKYGRRPQSGSTRESREREDSLWFSEWTRCAVGLYDRCVTVLCAKINEEKETNHRKLFLTFCSHYTHLLLVILFWFLFFPSDSGYITSVVCVWASS